MGLSSLVSSFVCIFYPKGLERVLLHQWIGGNICIVLSFQFPVTTLPEYYLSVFCHFNSTIYFIAQKAQILPDYSICDSEYYWGSYRWIMAVISAGNSLLTCCVDHYGRGSIYIITIAGIFSYLCCCF